MTDPARRLAEALHRRRLLRFLPAQFLRHYVYPLVAGGGAVAYDPQAFFDQWYASAPDGEFSDGITISHKYDRIAARFHYAAVETSILRYLAGRPDFQPRSVLDVGTGAGHWIEFYRCVLRPGRLMGVDLTAAVVDSLRERYRQDPEIELAVADVSSPALDLGARFELVNAIGVMFHIVDDERWEVALANLARHLEPGGLAVIGGQFGRLTRSVQFCAGPDGRKVCNKRIRSRRHWKRAAAAVGLRVESVVRSASEPGIVTPENNVLILSRVR